MFGRYDFRKFDYILVLTVVSLAVIGVVAIGSATRIYSPDGTAYFRNRQIVGYASGGVLMLFFAFFDYKWLGRLAIPIYLFNLGLLGAVLAVGIEVKGATRWISLGSFQLQPSEFAKIFLIIVLAKYLQMNEKRINRLYVLIGAVILTAIPWYLIFRQPDLSTSIIMFLILAFMLFVGGISFWYIFAALAVAVPTATFGFNYLLSPDQQLLESYQVNRILSIVDPSRVAPDLLWQTNNSKQAIGSGQLFGKGLYMGKVNQYDYLPEPQTDFIFSIIGEELGFFGCILVLLLLFFLIIRVLWIAKDADMLGKLIISGFAAVVMYQTFINVGVASGIVPNTGMPLPFISYGVSSLWNNLIGIGIILNISMQRKKAGSGATGVNSNQRGST